MGDRSEKGQQRADIGEEGMLEVIIEEVDLLDKVRKCEAKDDEVVKAVEEMKQVGIKMLRDEE